jgi:signal transduction histidine kinase
MKRRGWVCFEAIGRILLDSKRQAAEMLLAFALAWIPSVSALAAEGEVLRFRQADFLASDATAAPPDSAPWQPQALPDMLYQRSSSPGWYRVHAQLAQAPAEAYALYLPGIRADATFYVNGVEVGRTLPGDRRASSSFPQVRTVPRTLLRVGANVIHVRVTQAGSAWMSEIEFGPQTPVLARYDSGRFWRSTAPIAAIAVLAFVSFFTLILWYRRPEESAYGFFGLAAMLRLLPAARNLLPPIEGLPLGVTAWTFDLCLMTSIVMIWMFAHRYVGWKFPRLERALWLSLPFYAVLDAIVLWQGWFDSPLAEFCKAMSYAYAVGYCVPFVVLSARRRTLEATLLAVAFVAATVLAIIDGYFRPYGGLSWFTFRLVPLYLIVAWSLMSRFARSLDAAESLNTELATRVEAKRMELETNYRRLAVLEREQAVTAERARLMRDMHDGIGGQLISTLSLVESGLASHDKVAAALRECIDDLRLAIDSLEPTDDDLVPVLGNLRYRVEPRLKARGIALDWQVSDLPRLASMTPQNVLHVLRILQEAFTNVIKHAGASRVCVATRCEGERVLIDVRDDGKGLREDGAGAGGHGLANMRQRAQALGGELRLQASARGTTVTLGLPLAPAAAA